MEGGEEPPVAERRRGACRCTVCACTVVASCNPGCEPVAGAIDEKSPLLQPLLGGSGGGSGGDASPGSVPVHAEISVKGMQCSCCAVAAERAIM